MLRTQPSNLIERLARVALFAVLAAVPWAARGQTVPVEPYYAVVTGDNVPLKAGDMDGYYHVALLERGRLVWVDAEGGGWVRVAYPADLPVYVRAEEVTPEADSEFVVLTRQSGLKSVNQAGGFGKSWQRAMPRGEDAPIGTRLKVYAPIADAADVVIGYAVVPPAGARAYLKVGSLRAATDAEVEAYLDSLPATETTLPGSDEADADTPEPEPVVEPVVTPAETDGAAEPEIDLRDPEAGQPTTDAQPTPEPAEDIVRIDQGQAETEAEAQAHARLIGTLTQLSELFGRVQQQDSDTAELDELAAELRRAISAQGDDPAGQRIATSLGQRLQLIEMRIEAREVRRELRAKREAIDATYSQIATDIRELERTRGYQFVGRLVRSSVYDGNRLPLMYRMVSVNESVPRTIGYIMPGDDALGVTEKLGEIVGVLGSSTLDRDLNLRIVTPTRIDTLGPESLSPATGGQSRPGS